MTTSNLQDPVKAGRSDNNSDDAGKTSTEQGLRRAFKIRAERALEEIATKVSDRDLERAVSEPTDYTTLLTALETPEALELLRRDDPLAEAKLRGLRTRQKLLERCGRLFSSSEVAEHLGISRQAVNKRRRAGTLLGLSRGHYGYVYPSWQFNRSGVLEGLPEVLDALSGADAWMTLAFFLQDNIHLDGEEPLKVLQRGDLEAVLRAARAYGEQGAG